MKKLIVFVAMAISLSSYAQTDVTVSETESDTTANWLSRKHEVKVGALKLLAGAILEGTYEYIYSNEFTFGASALVSFDQGNYDENFSLTPFARVYFQDPKRYKARGFFIEGFGKYVNGKTYDSYYSYHPGGAYYDGYQNYDYRVEEKSYNSAVLGLAVGIKWLNRSGFVLELLAGGGRSLSSNNYEPEAYFRGDLNLGYRF